MKPPFLIGGAIISAMTCGLAAQAAAQTDITTPWVSHSAVFDLPSVPSGSPLAISSSGDVFLASQPGYIKPTKQAGDSTAASNLIVKVSGGQAVFALQLGGSESIYRMVPDAAGNVYVAGVATTGLPVTLGAYRGTPAGDGTPYICRLSGTDGTPIFCTYLADNLMQLTDMSVDQAGNVYVVANRGESTFGATPGAASLGNRQVLVMKFDPTGSNLIFAAEFGGSGVDISSNILVDSGGSAYTVGWTASQDFPGTTHSPLPPPPSAADLKGTLLGATPFVAKLNPAGAEIVYAVYGRSGEFPLNMAVDSAGEIHLQAIPFSTNHLAPLLVRKYTGDGTAIVYETPFETDASSSQSPIAVDDQGVVSIAGSTASIGFTVRHATATCAAPDSMNNAHLVRLSPAGDILQSTFLATNGPAIALAASVQSSGGYIAALIGSGVNQKLGVIQIGPDTTGTAGTALGCYGNGATFLGGPLAPGEIFTIFGDGLGPATGATYHWGSSQRLGTSLSGVAVTFDGTPAPLLYVQNSQINAIAPWEIAGKTATQLCASYSGKTSCTNAPVAAASPGIFQYLGSDGTLFPVALDQEGTLISLAHPAPFGSIISLWMTGLGLLSPAPADGSIVQPPLPTLSAQVQADFQQCVGVGICNLIPATVLYAGPAPFAVAGLYQVNLQIPEQNPSPGTLMLTLAEPDGSTYQINTFIVLQ